MGSTQSTSCEKLLGSSAVKIGKRDVDPDLNELRNETVTVLEIGLYRERCGIILHDFVGFRVRPEYGDKFTIKAEKLTKPARISVKQKIRWGKDDETKHGWGKDVETKHRCENLEDCGKIRMEDLLAILTEPSPDYNLMSDNCWSYADTTFKQVIRKFSETPSLSPERRSHLASFLNNAPPVMPDKVLRSVRFAAGVTVVLEIPLSTIIIIGVLGATAVAAAVVGPTTLATQVATFYTAVRFAGYPITLAGAQNAMTANTMTAAQAYAPQILHAVCVYFGVDTTSATQAVHAPLRTRAFRHLVSLKAFIIKCAVWVTPYLRPVAVAVLVIFILYVIYNVGSLVIEGISPGQYIKRLWRSLFPRRPLNQAQGLPPM